MPEQKDITVQKQWDDSIQHPDITVLLYQMQTNRNTGTSTTILYDTQTFYASIAALCGCIPIVVPEIGKTKEDYVKKDDHLLGIAYGDTSTEIEYAIQTREKVLLRINNRLSENIKNAENNEHLSENKFGDELTS